MPIFITFDFSLIFQDLLLFFIYIISIFLGIYTIISKNPVISVLFLIGLFTCISVYLIKVGLVFIGLSYLLVYVGAISILFLFILMLINIRISELVTDTNNSIVLAILTLLGFNFAVTNEQPINLSVFDAAFSYFRFYSLEALIGEGYSSGYSQASTVSGLSGVLSSTLQPTVSYSGETNMTLIDYLSKFFVTNLVSHT